MRNKNGVADLTGIENLDRSALIEKYQKLYGLPPPFRMSRNIIAMAIAYRLQEQASGGLNPVLRRNLVAGQVNPSAVSVGTVLIREWQGQHHTVTVYGDAVEYRCEHFTSLSAVARRITGQQRSGPAFFKTLGDGHGR